jgi:membrane associated rhomboid family serine protease
VHIHANDPAHTASPESTVDFHAAWIVALGFVAVIGIVHALNVIFGLDLARFGVHPREWAGLPGIVAAPLLHGDMGHLISNALPLAIAGTAMLFLYPDASRIVLPAIYFGPGLAVWIFGRDSVHIGASGIVYGLVSYVFVAGVLRRDRRAIAASLLVAFLYGALVWGVLPIRLGVSWETHLAAAIIGVVLALALRRRDVPPRKRYSWEDEPEAADDDGEWNLAGETAMPDGDAPSRPPAVALPAPREGA